MLIFVKIRIFESEASDKCLRAGHAQSMIVCDPLCGYIGLLICEGHGPNTAIMNCWAYVSMVRGDP